MRQIHNTFSPQFESSPITYRRRQQKSNTGREEVTRREAGEQGAKQPTKEVPGSPVQSLIVTGLRLGHPGMDCDAQPGHRRPTHRALGHVPKKGRIWAPVGSPRLGILDPGRGGRRAPRTLSGARPPLGSFPSARDLGSRPREAPGGRTPPTGRDRPSAPPLDHGPLK